MSDNTHLTSIRDTVIDAASTLGLSEPAITKTVVLIHGGHFVGRRFLFDGLQAVWLMAENIIRFFADDGALLKTVEVGQSSEKKAA
ncbi:MAG: hypothetical protein HQ567_03545 [Candidatus Nealsonbacteria bacterium]|nr:hypothetical protein [Candidatus Nealsonbacteria bacterium]